MPRRDISRIGSVSLYWPPSALTARSQANRSLWGGMKSGNLRAADLLLAFEAEFQIDRRSPIPLQEAPRPRRIGASILPLSSGRAAGINPIPNNLWLKRRMCPQFNRIDRLHVEVDRRSLLSACQGHAASRRKPPDGRPSAELRRFSTPASSQTLRNPIPGASNVFGALRQR